MGRFGMVHLVWTALLLWDAVLAVRPSGVPWLPRGTGPLPKPPAMGLQVKHVRLPVQPYVRGDRMGSQTALVIGPNI